MDSKLINKYFRGECSPEEVQQVLNWFGKNSVDPIQEQEMYQLWQASESDQENIAFAQDSARMLAGINEKIDRLENSSVNKNIPEIAKVTVKQRVEWKCLMKAAAAVFLPLCFVWLFISNNTNKDKVFSRLTTIETLPGVRKTLKLEDGSKITINGGSKVSYQKPFSRYTREITLRGEAFFEVAKDSLRPFIVKTGSLSTQALGTSFNIKYHVEDNDISVALATGSVKIEKQTKEGNSPIARLEPGKQLIFDKANQSYKVAAYDSLDILGWREGFLYFKKANLDQVVKKLESLYGIEIELTGKVPGNEKEWHYTGTYYNESLENVLEGIAFVKSFSYEKKDSKVYIKFN